LERALENEGYDTAVTVSGEVAFRILNTGAFDLLVLDDYLSDRHCIQVLTHFHRAGLKPMVVVTYYQLPSRAERKQLRALGVSTLVNKCAPIELVRTVHYLLRPLGRFNDPFDMT
jgi:DNA-binding response OmpR family regulator